MIALYAARGASGAAPADELLARFRPQALVPPARAVTAGWRRATGADYGRHAAAARDGRPGRA